MPTFIVLKAKPKKDLVQQFIKEQLNTNRSACTYMKKHTVIRNQFAVGPTTNIKKQQAAIEKLQQQQLRPENNYKICEKE
uniref:Uncharacterized protein n=1 Tax=Ditylenchus dipsaci TaxID=166011 RepID=A0A915D4P3_9BILA